MMRPLLGKRALGHRGRLSIDHFCAVAAGRNPDAFRAKSPPDRQSQLLRLFAIAAEQFDKAKYGSGFYYLY